MSSMLDSDDKNIMSFLNFQIFFYFPEQLQFTIFYMTYSKKNTYLCPIKKPKIEMYEID